MRPLGMADTGDSGIIRSISGSAELRGQLRRLGFAVGKRAAVLKSEGGSLLVGLEGDSAALDRITAMHITID